MAPDTTAYVEGPIYGGMETGGGDRGTVFVAGGWGSRPRWRRWQHDGGTRKDGRAFTDLRGVGRGKLVFRDEIERLKKRNSFDRDLCAGKPAAGMGGKPGLTRAMMERVLPASGGPREYFCGPDPMIDPGAPARPRWTCRGDGSGRSSFNFDSNEAPPTNRRWAFLQVEWQGLARSSNHGMDCNAVGWPSTGWTVGL